MTENKDKIILDLCGGTGSWSRPYKNVAQYHTARLCTGIFPGESMRRTTMNEQEVCPEGRKAILCDKDRCRWRTGLCPPFRGNVCPFGGGTITYRTDSDPVVVDAKAINGKTHTRGNPETI